MIPECISKGRTPPNYLHVPVKPLIHSLPFHLTFVTLLGNRNFNPKHLQNFDGEGAILARPLAQRLLASGGDPEPL